MKLWLDDVRPAPDDSWLVARSVRAAKQVFIEQWHKLEPIHHISFDHDLGENAPTGMDFAKWVVAFDLAGGSMKNFTFSVHSQNPCGAENIRSLLNCYFNRRHSEVK